MKKKEVVDEKQWKDFQAQDTVSRRRIGSCFERDYGDDDEEEDLAKWVSLVGALFPPFCLLTILQLHHRKEEWRRKGNKGDYRDNNSIIHCTIIPCFQYCHVHLQQY